MFGISPRRWFHKDNFLAQNELTASSNKVVLSHLLMRQDLPPSAPAETVLGERGNGVVICTVREPSNNECLMIHCRWRVGEFSDVVSSRVFRKIGTH